MDEKVNSHFLRINPLLLRLVLWPAIVGLLVWEIVGEVPAGRDVDFHLTGNRTNLYAVAADNPSGSDDEGVMVYSRLDARRQWSRQARRSHGANLLQTIAWQEDLICLYDSGGMFFVGPSDFDYQGPPVSSWQPIAVAVSGRTVMALGLDEDGKPLFSQMSKKDQWGTAEVVDLVVNWTAETARVARAAVRKVGQGGEFHVVWSEPVASSPIGDRPGRRKLRFAWRDKSGIWKGPFDDASINPAGPLSLAAVGPLLGMVYLAQPAMEPEAERELVYARFFPDDGRWHVVPEVKFELPDDRLGKIESYGLARFRDGLVVVVRDEQDEAELFHLDPQVEQVAVDRELQPSRLIVPVTGDLRSMTPTDMLVLALAAVLVTVLALRAFRRRTVPPDASEEEAYRARASRVAAYQVEKLMYLPVLIRRSLAFLIDLSILTLVMLPIVGIGWPRLLRLLTDLELLLQDWSALRILYVTFTCTMFVYFTVMELIWNRTLGKMLCGLRVVNLAGERPAWWRIVDRNLVRPFEFVMAIGLLVILWTPRSQRIGDLVGGTQVVMTRRLSGRPQEDDTRTM